MGIGSRPRFTDQERDNIIEMANRGFSPKEIGKKFGRTPIAMAQVIWKMRKAGLIKPYDPTERKQENND